MIVYRLTRRRYIDLTGEGARLVGGRCNPVGVPAVYTSAHVSLAFVEILVHLDRVEIPSDYALMGIELKQTLIPEMTIEGAREISKNRHDPVIRVRSFVIPRESNYVLYPEAHGFDAKIAFTERFEFDARLFSPHRTF